MNNSHNNSNICLICGDTAVGYHYGAVACFGCKGFFRRTIRKKRVYTCLSSRNCVITKEGRNQCRFCRFKRCVQIGMKKEAVQEERSKAIVSQEVSDIDKGTLVVPSSPTTPTYFQFFKQLSSTLKFISLDLLLQPMDNNKSRMSKVFCPFALSDRREIFDLLSTDLMQVVEWAKGIPTFMGFDMDEQVALIRAHATELVILETIRRSLHVQTDEDCMIVANGMRVVADVAPIPSSPKIANMRRRLVEEIVRPCRRLGISKEEFACIQGLLLFDPDAPQVKQKDKVYTVRNEISFIIQTTSGSALEHIQQARVPNVLLLLPKLQSIATELVEATKMARMFGMEIPRVFREVILGEEEDKPEYNEAMMMSSLTAVDVIQAVGQNIETVTGDNVASSEEIVSTYIPELEEIVNDLEPSHQGILNLDIMEMSHLQFNPSFRHFL